MWPKGGYPAPSPHPTFAITVKTKIIFIYPRIGPLNTEARAPLSVMTLAPGLEAAGFQPVILDMRVEPDFRQALNKHLGEALYVGISTMTGRQIYFALEAARLVRDADPRIPIVWGGVHPSLFPRETVSHPLVDFVAQGEGEETVVDLARCLSEGGDPRLIQGLYWRDERGVPGTAGERGLLDMAKAPPAAWHLIDPSRYFGVGIETARGCPWRCRFCFNRNYNKGRWRAKAVPTVLEEMSLLRKRYGHDMVWLVDDNYFTQLDRVRRISEGLVEANMGLGWSTAARANTIATLDPDLVELLKRSGLRILFVGVESGSPRTLEYIQKDCTVEQIETMARRAAQHQLQVHSSLVVGFPEETEEDWGQTFDLMDRLRTIHPGIVLEDVFIFTPYPGTELYEEALKMGFVPPAGLEAWGNFSFYDCNLPWLTPQQKSMLQNLSLLTRLVFWSEELEHRHVRWYQRPFYKAVRADAQLRWKLRAFRHAPEYTLLRKYLDAWRKLHSLRHP